MLKSIMFVIFFVISSFVAPAYAGGANGQSLEATNRVASDADYRSKGNQTRSYSNKLNSGINAMHIAQLRQQASSLQSQINKICDGEAGDRGECLEWVRKDLSSIKGELQRIDAQVNSNSKSITALEGKVAEIERKLNRYGEEILDLRQRVSRLESRHTFAGVAVGPTFFVEPAIPDTTKAGHAGLVLTGTIGGENAFNGYSLNVTGMLGTQKAYGGNVDFLFFRNLREGRKSQGVAVGGGIGFAGRVYGARGTPGYDAYAGGVRLNGVIRFGRSQSPVDISLLPYLEGMQQARQDESAYAVGGGLTIAVGPRRRI